MKDGKLRVALVGMSFGAEFIPIYVHHPDVYSLVLVDSNPTRLCETAEKFQVKDYMTDYREVLADPTIDAVHLVIPPALHAPMSIQALEAGKHCACTIPMGLSMDELYGIIRARKASGKRFMFMETSVYTREFLYVKERYEKGEMGRIQYMNCAHYQDMEGWPEYWMGFPPMMHSTHATAPCLTLGGARPASVFGKGSGKVRDELIKYYGCPYAFESAFITLEGEETVIESECFRQHVARAYSECFSVYCEKKSFEWQQLESERPVMFTMEPGSGTQRGSTLHEERVDVPDYAHRLPKEIGRFTRRTVYDESNPHLSFLQGGGHGGSHPHLVNEFVHSIIEDREPYPSDIDGAYWTAVGLLAHESAMEGGVVKAVPNFDEMK